MQGLIDNFLNVEVFFDSLTLLWLGFLFTLKLVAGAFILALILGLPVVYFRTRRSRIVRNATIFYLDVSRAIPPLVSLVLAYYALPAMIGLSMTTLQAAIITFGLIQAAYVGEIYRGGIIAIDRGQIDAATAFGLSDFQAARLVLIPQIARVVIPPLTSQATQVVRDSSLAFFIGYAELLTRAREAQNLFSNSTPILAAAGMYCILMLLMQALSYRLERSSFSRTI